MGQLLTLMVFGDMITADADNKEQPQRQPQQSTAGRSTEVTRYRMAQHDDDDEIEFEGDLGTTGAHYTNSTELGLTDPETSCSGGTVTTDERHWGDESDSDGAVHRSGKFCCNPSELESWTCTVHRHRTGVVGDARASSGSSGRGSGADDDDGDRFQLMKIMCMPDQEARLRALQRYLPRSGSGAEDEGPPPDPRLATSSAHRGAANVERGSTESDDNSFPRRAHATSESQRRAISSE